MDVTLCSLSAGGIAHYSYALALALTAASVRTTMLTYDEPEYDLADFPHPHRLVVGLQMATTRRKKLTSPPHNLLSMLKTTRSSDVVHFQWALGERSDRLHWPVLRRLRKKIVYTAHDVLPHEASIMSLEHCQWVYGKADALIVHGQNLRNLLLERFDVDASKVHVIPHGNYNFVADTPSRWNRDSARRSFGFDEDDRVVLFFGLIRPYKGLDDLLVALGSLKDKLGAGQRLRVLVAGRAIDKHWEEAGYAELIRKGGLSAELHLEHIPMGEVGRFMHAADVVAIPYKRGSQSGVLQLAHAFGKPSVVTDVGSLKEVMQAGRTADLVPAENPEALGEAIGGLLRDRDRAAAYGAAAREFTEKEFGWTPIAAKTVALYSSLRDR